MWYSYVAGFDRPNEPNNLILVSEWGGALCTTRVDSHLVPYGTYFLFGILLKLRIFKVPSKIVVRWEITNFRKRCTVCYELRGWSLGIWQDGIPFWLHNLIFFKRINKRYNVICLLKLWKTNESNEMSM